jgi:hypothetical protein
MTRILRWGSVLFVGSTSTLLVLVRFEPRLDTLGISGVILAFVCVTLVTLPLAIISVWRESDSASRRNWLLLLGICVLLLVAVALLSPSSRSSASPQ